MDIRQVDVAVIGGGTAAMNARRAVEKAGGTPVIIESDQFGTMCARVGCMPRPFRRGRCPPDRRSA